MNDVNQSPSDDSQIVGVESSPREDLRKVATYQRGVLVCLLLQMATFAGLFMAPPALTGLVYAVYVLSGIAATVFVFLLALRVYGGAAAGVFLGLLTLVPCIGLLVLLITNSKATGILKQNGIRVGLLGANLSEI